jgi:hypothetical protein
MLTKAFVSLLGLALSSPLAAEVVEQRDNGFATRNIAATKASPQQIFAALGQPSFWWNGQHSYTGDAKNLTLSLAPGGCFCETGKDGMRIEHARVVLVIPNSTLRLHGALGPLQAEGVTGSLSWDVKPAPGGGSEIIQTYVVGGFFRGGGAGKLAPLVDGVMREQLTRLAAHLGVAN